MNAHAKSHTKSPVLIDRADPTLPILTTSGPTHLAIRAGTSIITNGRTLAYTVETDIDLPAMKPGQDYGLTPDDNGGLVITALDTPDPMANGVVAGFHFAPGGNAEARAGGDAIPAINPFSLWDLGFRPSSPDPRGMALIDMPDGRRFWSDIYLLGRDHQSQGTSRHAEKIADGRSIDRLDFPTANKIVASHGKRLMTYDEFRVAAAGVTERSSAGRDPDITGLDAARTSRFGLMQATGNLWIWGTDGDEPDPRPSIFGGSWISGSNSGSRYASLGFWPGDSDGSFGARAACDHLNPA